MSSTFCPMPFVHLNLKHEGKVSACWRYPDKLGNYTENSLAQIWNGSQIKELRRAILNNEQPNGCRSCWDMESSGATSTRQNCQETFNEATEEYVKQNLNKDYSYNISNIKSVEVRFDNICNLMCRFCSPDYSSVWEQAVKKDIALSDKMVEYGTYRKADYHIKLTDEIIDEITLNIAPYLDEIMIAGGEPLYHEKHYKFLEQLQPVAKNLRLSYNTNLNTTEYKGKSILDLWQKFKKIWIRISIDGDPECYSYVRAGGNLKKVEDNIIKLKLQLTNANISATCTTCLYNITRFINIIEYYTSLNVYFHTSLVQYPKALNIKLLPKHLKEKITNDFNNWLMYGKDIIKEKSNLDVEEQYNRIKKFGNNVINYMNAEDWHDQWQSFLDYSDVLDKHHKTNLFEVYPEYKI